MNLFNNFTITLDVLKPLSLNFPILTYMLSFCSVVLITLTLICIILAMLFWSCPPLLMSVPGYNELVSEIRQLLIDLAAAQAALAQAEAHLSGLLSIPGVGSAILEQARENVNTARSIVSQILDRISYLDGLLSRF